MNLNQVNGIVNFRHFCHAMQVCFVAVGGPMIVQPVFGGISPYATGGEVTRIELPNCRVSYVHTFTNADEVMSFASTGKRALNVRYLVVGAGGSGSGAYVPSLSSPSSGAGGGGGGVCEKSGIVFGTDSVWTVLVGKGASSVDAVAGASSISNGVVDVETVPGGGNAGLRISGSEYRDATSGAAGGGASTTSSGSHPGASGTYASSVLGVSYGKFSGGGSTKRQGGGGGGASQNGGDAKSADDDTTPGTAKGGEGLVSDITGEALVYGSGGGAGECRFTSGENLYRYQGADGGTRAGNGSKYSVDAEGGLTYTLATAPAPNSGAGGGGAGFNGVRNTEKNSASTGGADGIVVIRYDVVESPCEGGDVVTKTLKRGTKYTYVHTFTNSAAASSFVNHSGKNLNVRYLVVGAGGSGSGAYVPSLSGSSSGAGGGGGGVCEKRGIVFGADSAWTVLVGKGASSVDAVAGSSSISNGVVDVETVPGGGNAGLRISSSEYRDATSGAAGGGASTTSDSSHPGASGTYASSILGVSYGKFSGGKSTKRQGGGGGGASQNGGDSKIADDDVTPGAAKGGEGVVSDITGEALVYGSGGGAGECRFTNNDILYRYQGADGGTRAGNGSKYSVDAVGEVTYTLATAPAPNSGAGGGGAGFNGVRNAEKNSASTGGADGIVVIRYEYDENPPGLILLFR